MSTLTDKYLNLVKPELTDDYKVTIGTDLPANFQKIDDEFSAHLADLVTDIDGVHGFVVEKGTWAPAIYGSTQEGNVNYVFREGMYIKQGRLVFIRLYIGFNIKPDFTGNIMIKGLPFAGVNSTPLSIYQAQGFDYPANYQRIGCSVAPGSSQIIFLLDGDNIGSSPLSDVHISSTIPFRLMIAGTYEAS